MPEVWCYSISEVILSVTPYLNLDSQFQNWELDKNAEKTLPRYYPLPSAKVCTKQYGIFKLLPAIKKLIDSSTKLLKL